MYVLSQYRQFACNNVDGVGVLVQHTMACFSIHGSHELEWILMFEPNSKFETHEVLIHQVDRIAEIFVVFPTIPALSPRHAYHHHARHAAPTNLAR